MWPDKKRILILSYVLIIYILFRITNSFLLKSMHSYWLLFSRVTLHGCLPIKV